MPPDGWCNLRTSLSACVTRHTMRSSLRPHKRSAECTTDSLANDQPGTDGGISH
jgi:hypothetical protein